jgi:hypothetical protein
MAINHEDYEQISHIARLAVFALVARGVAGVEFENMPEVQTVLVRVSRPVEGEQAAIDMEFYGSSSVPLGGVAL